MTSDEALWVARKHLESSAPGRVGMLLSDEAVHTVCEALVHACELVDAQDAMLKQAQAREDALRAQLDAVTQVATEPSGISTAVDQHIAAQGAAPLVVPEDRTKPPPGYEPFWGCRCGSSRHDAPDYDARYCVWFEGKVVAHGNTLPDAIAAAWARRDARAKR